MGAVQFIGKEKVIGAYTDLDGSAWGLFSGSKPIVYGEGADTLEDWLDRFDPAGSTGVYTLRVYDVSLPVKPTTDCIGQFNFKLYDPYQGAGIGGHTTKLLDRIGELEKRLDEGDGGDDITDHIIGWFKDPEKLETAIGAFKQLFNQPGPAQVPGQNEQAMGGFKVTSSEDPNEERLARLAVVLDKLEGKDRKLLDHLEKLAKLDDLTFNLIISKLDAL